MKFIDPIGTDPGTTQVAYRKLNADIQVHLEELDHSLAPLGGMVVIRSYEKNVLSMEIWITDKG